MSPNGLNATPNDRARIDVDPLGINEDLAQGNEQLLNSTISGAWERL